MAGAAQEGQAKSGSSKGIMFGLLAALILGAGGFFATYSGMISSGGQGAAPAGAHGSPSYQTGATPAFVKLDPLIISLSHSSVNRHLRFAAQLEVNPDYVDEVTALTPRVLDVLNDFLRAVAVQDIEDPATFSRLRAQMLRRIIFVTGKDRVRDLLISEFVLN